MKNFTPLKAVIDEHLSDYVQTPSEHYHVAKRQIVDWWREFVYAWERAWQGYDRTELWSHKSAHTERVLDILKRYRHNRCGSPMFDFSDDDPHKAWDAILDRMIAGFEAHDVIDRMDYDENDYEFWHKVFKDGIELYAENYLSLWD